VTAPAPLVPMSTGAAVALRGALPAADAILLGAVGVSGAVAGYVAGPELWMATAGVFAILTLASRRASAARRGADGLDLAELPRELRLVVQDAVAALCEDDAQRMLMAVVQPARAWFGARESAFDPRQDTDMRRHVADLVADSCAIALELGRLEGAAPADVLHADSALVARYHAARTLLTKRLGDAASALSQLYASGVERGTPASDRVAELVSEIQEEAAARTAAKAELEALLPPLA